MLVPNFPAGTSHVGQVLDFNTYSVTFAIWSATHADKIENHQRTFTSPQSSWTPSRAGCCKGPKMNSNTSCSVLGFTCLWY